jgi:hypothetical protein
VIYESGSNLEGQIMANKTSAVHSRSQIFRGKFTGGLRPEYDVFDVSGQEVIALLMLPFRRGPRERLQRCRRFSLEKFSMGMVLHNLRAVYPEPVKGSSSGESV